ncbi:MAG: hypothetical protein ABIQ95_01815, partial [Bdellovibrionia bacterium]
MAVIVLIFSWGLSVQAQLLPTSESKIRLNKNKTIRLNETEVTSNRDWAFMWHWLNAPSHHEYKEEMIKKFKHYTYQDGTETKFKRPFIEELDKNKQPEKSDHFITRDLLHIDKLAPFFTASQKLYCKDPDNVSEDYCKEGANRREIWEEKTQAHLLETDIDELGTQGLFRRANHALVMHKYLA